MIIKTIAVAIAAAAIFSGCKKDDASPAEISDGRAYPNSIYAQYYTGSSTTEQVKFMICNETDKAVHWIKFKCIYRDTAGEVVINKIFEFGSKTDKNMMTIDPGCTQYTPSVKYQMPLIYVSDDAYSWNYEDLTYTH